MQPYVLRIALGAAILLLLVGIIYDQASGSVRQFMVSRPVVSARVSPSATNRTMVEEEIAEETAEMKEKEEKREIDDKGPLPWYPMLEVIPQAPDPEFTIKKQLLPNLVAPNIHYIWCGNSRWFTFKEYLSLHSTIRAIRPDKIVFYYEEIPKYDRVYYNQWLDDLKHDNMFFELHKMDNWTARYCGDSHPIKLNVIMTLLNQSGGIFIGETTWLLKFPAMLRRMDFINGMEPTSTEGFIMMRRGVWHNESLGDLMKNKQLKSQTSICANVEQFYRGATHMNCLIVRGPSFAEFHPMQIWELDDLFGRMVRRLYYGSESIIKPKPSYDELVPNIAHMIWLGGGPMNFVFYLSVLSLLYVVKVDMVYIHGDKEPAGPYWPMVKNNSRITFITRHPPFKVYQGEIEPFYVALMSDLIRVDLMIKYGGIYTDTDAIWVKPLSYEERGYGAVAAFDWVDWSYPFPDSINFGISYGKRNAPFWRIFRESMRKLHNEVHGFTGVMEPYKLMEKYPNLIRIDPHLQVICYQMRCHPTWVKDYHNMTKDHITMNSIPNWREDVHAFHWTHPDPPELKNQSALMRSNTIFAQLGKFVLKKAGLI